MNHPITLRCHENCFAFIGESRVKEAVGRVVKVLTMPPIVPSNWPDWAPWPAWECEAVQEIRCDQGWVQPGEKLVIPDAWLLPFSPDSQKKLEQMLAQAKARFA